MKHRRSMAPPGLALLTLFCFAAGAAQAGTWTNLWSTREQQAQKLLDASNPAAAAPLFSDPRRRAYAEMEAGQYSQAAKSLEPFKDADSQYNRGNALAHSGQLREALAAYDAALRAAPGDQDVIRNRDLVRQALEQQQNQSGKQGGGNGRSGGQGSKGGQSQGGGQSQAGSQPPGSGQSQAGQPQGNQSQPGGQSQANNPSQAADRQPQGGNQRGGNSPQTGGQSQAGGQAPQPQAANPVSAQSSAQAGAQTPAGSVRPGDNPSGEGALAPNGQQTNGATAGATLNAENAQQDADAALRYRQSQQARPASGANPNDTGRGTILAPDGRTRSSADVPVPKPPSEQSLALDQWLRGIPDDSGELLRRKFLIEHRLRQRANEQ